MEGAGERVVAGEFGGDTGRKRAKRRVSARARGREGRRVDAVSSG
jgi:hypothetical protein